MSYLVAFTAGFVCASPLGPMGLLCLRRVLALGLTASLEAIAGMACADAVWAFITAHGMRVLTDWLLRERVLLAFASGTFFLAIGLHGLLRRPRASGPADAALLRLGGFMPNFVVVFFNPATCMFISAAFALLYVVERHDPADAFGITLGVFVGAISFWLLVGGIGSRFRHRLGNRQAHYLDRGISATVMLFGVAVLISELV